MLNGYILINLTSKPVFVTDGVRLTRLPEGPPPRAIEMSSSKETSSISVIVGNETFDIKEVHMSCPLMKSPPAAEGVLWLVESDVLSQFPQREDFLRPSLYSMVSVSETIIDEHDVECIKSCETLPGVVMALTAVTRSRRTVDVGAVEESSV